MQNRAREVSPGLAWKDWAGRGGSSPGKTQMWTCMGHWVGAVIVKSHPVTKSISTVWADQSWPCSGNISAWKPWTYIGSSYLSPVLLLGPRGTPSLYDCVINVEDTPKEKSVTGFPLPRGL
jgi:hypothetical protein